MQKQLCTPLTRVSLCAQAGFCERFNPQYLEVKRAVESGAIGSIRAIQSSRVAPYSLGNPAWELGILDTAVHNFDLILWLMKQTPLSVQSVGSRRIPGYSDCAHSHHDLTLRKRSDGD